MLAHRTSIFSRRSIAVAVAVFGGTIALAEDDANEPAAENQVIEEMVITAGEKSDDPVDLDALYEERMRERVMREQERMRALEEENEWRNPAAATVENPARIQWGYNTQDELKMRRESNMFDDVQQEPVKPATVFRVGF